MNEPKTVRVRIAIGVSSESRWYVPDQYGPRHTAEVPRHLIASIENIRGSGSAADIRWIEADVPLPSKPTTIEAVSVTPAEEG